MKRKDILFNSVWLTLCLLLGVATGINVVYVLFG